MFPAWYLYVLLAAVLVLLVLIAALRRQLQEERQNAQLFHSLFDLAPFSCALLDSNGKFVLVNQTFIDSVKRPQSQIIGNTQQDLMGRAQSPEALAEARKKLFANGFLKNETAILIGPDQHETELVFSARVLPYHGTPHILTATLDMSELKALKDTLRKSEFKFRTIVESLPVAVGIANQQGDITYVNPAFVQILGYEQYEIPHIDIWIEKCYPDPAYREQSRQLWQSDIANTLQNNEKSSPKRIYRVVAKNSIALELEIGFTLIDDNIYTVFRDVTEQRRAEQELLASERRAAQQRSALARISLDTGLEGLSQNTVLEHICGVLAHTIGAQRTSVWKLEADHSALRCLILFDSITGSFSQGQVIDPKLYPNYFEAIQKENLVYAADTATDLRTMEMRKDYLLPAGIEALLDAGIKIDGKLVGIVSCEQVGSHRKWFADEEAFVSTLAAIVAQLMVNLERRQANQRALNKNQEMEQLIYVASHDMRSPLVNIHGFGKELEIALGELQRELQQLDNPEEGALHNIAAQLPAMAEAITQIRQNTRKMDALINGLLKVGRVGREHLDIRILDMDTLLAPLLGSWNTRAQRCGAQVLCAPLPPCKGDSMQIKLAFDNIVENAFKFLDPSRPGLIRISGTSEPTHSVYCIEDNGIGIDSRHADKIFELFHKLNPADNTGEGLGLALVRQILTRLDGVVWVESKLGEGSRFFVRLPNE